MSAKKPDPGTKATQCPKCKAINEVANGTAKVNCGCGFQYFTPAIEVSRNST